MRLKEEERDRGDDTGNESGNGNGHDSDNGHGFGKRSNNNITPRGEGKTFVHQVFEGILTNETKFLCCETVTNKDESFLDLSIDIEDNCSLTHCLRNFSAIETLERQDKFYCDTCNSLQEAEKCMKVKKLPNTLIIHLKRFKYDNNMQCRKLLYRVVFPLELRLWNTATDTENPERYYDLFAIVVHIGSGPHAGHYICFVKKDDVWLVFDDEDVSVIHEETIQDVFGSLLVEGRRSINTGYLLFFKTREEEAPPEPLGGEEAEERKPKAPEKKSDDEKLGENWLLV